MIHTSNTTLRSLMAGEVTPISGETSTSQSLFHFMTGIITRQRMMGKHRTSETYRATLRSFVHFREKTDINFPEIDSELMLTYESWLHGRGVSKNSSSFYLRILRAVYNRATEEGLTEDRHPFRHVYTGVDKTVKRAIPFRSIKKIKHLNLSGKPSLDFARDLFLFSFYTRGMSFIDMARLKKKDLQSGILTYRRQKTGQLLFIKWERCMQDFIDKHPADPAGPYLLPILTHPYDNHRQYHNIITRINRHLKKIGRMANLPIPLSLYVARHSWASIARSKHIPLSVISEGMGHDSERTTQIYLASLDKAKVDRANKMILKDL